MTEQTGAEIGKVQLHLRVSPAVTELLDAVRGPATRNAYAAMLLERALRQEAGAAVPEQGRWLVREEARPSREAELSAASLARERARDAREDAAPERAANDGCTHPGVGRKQRCPKCGRYNL